MLFTEPIFLFLFLPVLLALYFASDIARGLHRAGIHATYGNWLLLVDVYHEFSAPQAMLRRIREAL